jgi:hypothetical protein
MQSFRRGRIRQEARTLLAVLQGKRNGRGETSIQAGRHFIVEFPRTLVYLPGMSQTLEKRVEELEKKVAELSAKPARLTRKKDWRRTFGIFKDDPDFEEAVRLGREYREQQTYEKEIAGS